MKSAAATTDARRGETPGPRLPGPVPASQYGAAAAIDRWLDCPHIGFGSSAPANGGRQLAKHTGSGSESCHRLVWVVLRRKAIKPLAFGLEGR
jgi:hypothetical protein